mmetsp:Transcript_28073/g.71030  ORF Transcript_28073/g.71030 Transcript_28073/m.71030 type:complete len:516 (+) Transcript_28073:39-1586(+)
MPWSEAAYVLICIAQLVDRTFRSVRVSDVEASVDALPCGEEGLHGRRQRERAPRDEPHHHERAAQDRHQGREKFVPPLILSLEEDREGLNVEVELGLWDLFLWQPREPLLVVELVSSLTATAHRADHLEVMNPCLVEAVRHVSPVVERTKVGHDLVRKPRPSLTMVPAIARVGEREVPDEVRHVGHARVQVLVTPASRHLQVAGHPRYLNAALCVAAPLRGVMVRHPTICPHLDRPLQPADDLRLTALAVEERVTSVCLVETEHGVRVDALLAAEGLEVHAVYSDEAHASVNAVLVFEEHGRLVAFAVHALGDLVPLWGELHAVAAPAGKEVDEREVVAFDDVVEAVVLETIVRVGPISIQLLLSILLCQLRHGSPVILLALPLAWLRVRALVRLGGHTIGAAPGVHRAEPEVLGQCVDLHAALREHGHPEVAALDVVHVHVEVDLQAVRLLRVQRERGAVRRAHERADLADEREEHEGIGHYRQEATSLGGFNKVTGQPLRGVRGEHHRGGVRS